MSATQICLGQDDHYVVCIKFYPCVKDPGGVCFDWYYVKVKTIFLVFSKLFSENYILVDILVTIAMNQKFGKLQLPP